jgi:hypothetical protein
MALINPNWLKIAQFLKNGGLTKKDNLFNSQEDAVAKWGLPSDTRNFTNPTPAGTPDIKNYNFKEEQSKVATSSKPYDFEGKKRGLFGYKVSENPKYTTPLTTGKITSATPLIYTPKEQPVENVITKTNAYVDNLFNTENYGSSDKKQEGNADPTLADKLYASSMKNIKEQKTYNTVKTIGDAILAGGSLLGNALAGRPEYLAPGKMIAPTYKSAIPEYKNAIERKMAGTLAAGLKVARETGQMNLMPGILANAQSEENTAMGNLAAQDIAQSNEQAKVIADTENLNTQTEYAARDADNKMMDTINATRSEVMAKQATNLFSTIPNNYMQNKGSLADMGDKAEIYKSLIDAGKTEEAWMFLKGQYGDASSLQAVKENASQNSSGEEWPVETYYYNADKKPTYRAKDGRYYELNAEGKIAVDADGNPVKAKDFVPVSKA